ncbi:hypothetical protein AB833_11215 [Chromatiales bacterium (ex Bugula neritina AB1)]|nr:hypothetical protein AB833_11215 [Chromatiales bacterium (ex Bugula neritina AB1)]
MEPVGLHGICGLLLPFVDEYLLLSALPDYCKTPRYLSREFAGFIKTKIVSCGVQWSRQQINSACCPPDPVCYGFEINRRNSIE